MEEVQDYFLPSWIVLRTAAARQQDIFAAAAGEAGTVRDVGRIEVSFTPRQFPTPVRESTTPKEEEVSIRLFCFCDTC